MKSSAAVEYGVLVGEPTQAPTGGGGQVGKDTVGPHS